MGNAVTASIYYAPIADGLHLDVGGTPSVFVEQMTRVFGDQPWSLDTHDYDKLHTLAALWSQPIDNPFDKLIDSIRESGPIKVWAVY